MTEEAFDVTVVGSCMTDLVRWVRPLCSLFTFVDEAEAVSVPCALPEMTISQAESSEKAERGLACQIRDQETPPLPQVGPTGSSTPGMLWWPNLDTLHMLEVLNSKEAKNSCNAFQKHVFSFLSPTNTDTFFLKGFFFDVQVCGKYGTRADGCFPPWPAVGCTVLSPRE